MNGFFRNLFRSVSGAALGALVLLGAGAGLGEAQAGAKVTHRSLHHAVKGQPGYVAPINLRALNPQPLPPEPPPEKLPGYVRPINLRALNPQPLPPGPPPERISPILLRSVLLRPR